MKEDVIYPSMVIRSQAETIELLEKQLKQIQNNWNDLKALIKDWKEDLEFYEEDLEMLDEGKLLTLNEILELILEIESRK